jgi:phospholipase A1
MSIDTVVFVPGICGSVLKEGDTTVWLGTPANAVFETYPDKFVDLLATSRTIRATDVLRSLPLTIFGVPVYHLDGYGRALSSLEGMGFRETSGTLIPFAYDWRADIRTSAAALHARLSEPDVRGKPIAIVAHSMGGLVTRYALEKIGMPVGVRLEIVPLVASPHLGAPAALQNVLGRRPEIFLSAAQCRAVLRNPEFPSAYQLLPPPGIPALLAVDPQSGFLIQDSFDTAFARQLDLVQGSLDAASAFAADLPHRPRLPTAVPVRCYSRECAEDDRGQLSAWGRSKCSRRTNFWRRHGSALERRPARNSSPLRGGDARRHFQGRRHGSDVAGRAAARCAGRPAVQP